VYSIPVTEGLAAWLGYWQTEIRVFTIHVILRQKIPKSATLSLTLT